MKMMIEAPSTVSTRYEYKRPYEVRQYEAKYLIFSMGFNMLSNLSLNQALFKNKT